MSIRIYIILKVNIMVLYMELRSLHAISTAIITFSVEYFHVQDGLLEM